MGMWLLWSIIFLNSVPKITYYACEKIPIVPKIVTGFAKRGLSHTSTFMTLKDHNLISAQVRSKPELLPCTSLC